MQRSQLARAIFEKIETDLRNAVFVEPDADTTDENDAFVVNDETGQVRVEVINRDEKDLTSGIGIVGDADWLIIQTTPLSRRSQVANNIADGQQLAMWQVHSRQVDSISNGLSRSQIARQAIDLITGPALTEKMRDESISLNLIASEVRSVQFRYLSAGQWQPSWESITEHRLPRAVEVTIGFRELEQVGGDRDTFRLVIAINASEPYIPEQQFSGFSPTVNP